MIRPMTVFVRGLRFHSHHGVTEREREHGQWLEADIRAEVDTRAGHTDDVGDTVDYVELARLMVQTSHEGNAHTLERLLETYTDNALSKWPIINRLTVEVSKPNPLLNPTMAAIGVRIEKSRAR